MKTIITTFAVALCIASCSLTSQTIIKPKDSFVLGNNPHGSFKVKLKNVSKQNLEIHHEPISGGSHSYLTVKPSQSAKVKVEANTALIISNKSNDTTAVNLVVTGDTQLGMGYNNK